MIINNKLYDQLVDLEQLINHAPKKVVRELTISLLNMIHENILQLQDTSDNILNARYNLLLMKIEKISPMLNDVYLKYRDFEVSEGKVI